MAGLLVIILFSCWGGRFESYHHPNPPTNMKKVLLTVIATFYSVALFAQQAPATPSQDGDAPKTRTETPKPKKEKKAKKVRKTKFESKDSDEGDKVKTDNH